MSISLIGEITPTPSAELKTVPADRVSYVLIGEDADGQRLDNFLFRIAKGVPKGHVYRVIRAGEVRVSKKRAKAETKLMLGDVVRIPPMRVAQNQRARRLLRRSLKECSPYFTRTGISLSCSNPPALQLTAVRAFHMD